MTLARPITGRPFTVSWLVASVLGVLAVALSACQDASAPARAPSASEDGAADTALSFTPEVGLEDFFTCIGERDLTLVSAHRGGAGPGLAENALATLDASRRAGALILEVDVRQAADGALVLMHDDTLSRTTTCRGDVADTTSAALARCSLRDARGRAIDGAPPTLEDALSWARGRAVLQLDIKRETPFEDVADAVNAARAHDHVVLITYSLGAAKKLARLAPGVMISTPIEAVGDLGELSRAGLDSERIIAWAGTDQPNPGLFSALDRRDVEVAFGTLGPPSRSIDGEIARANDDQRYAEIAALGVNVLATDRPVEALAGLGARAASSDDIAACAAGG